MSDTIGAKTPSTKVHLPNGFLIEDEKGSKGYLTISKDELTDSNENEVLTLERE